MAVTQAFSLIVAVNDREVLKSTLLASPDLSRGLELVLEEGAKSAATAYNRGMQRAHGDVLVFLHQDVFLPAGWFESVNRSILQIEATGEPWALLGVFGMGLDGRGRGHLYSTGLKRLVGAPLEAPAPVQTLDEVVLILRRNTGLRFDGALPGFHLYGADICLTARERGWSCFAIDSFCLHNTNGIRLLPPPYWQAYAFMRKKWRHVLPVATTCMPLTRWGGAALWYRVKALAGRGRRFEEVGGRVADPVALYQRLVRDASRL